MSNNKHLLIITSSPGKGTVHLDKLIPSLVNIGYKITLLGWDRLKEYPKSYHENGVHYKMIFRGWGFANKWLAIALPIFVLKAFIELCRIKKEQFPVIMGVDFDATLPVALAKKINKIPFIYNIRDNFVMRPKLPNYIRSIIQKVDNYVVKKASQVVVPDESRIIDEWKIYSKKFHVVYNGAIDIPPPSQLPKQRPFTIYAMGYLMKTRGIHLLIEVSKRLPEIRILLAGPIYENDLREQITLIKNIDYRGRISTQHALALCYESDLIFTFYDPVAEINRKAASNKWFDAMMASKPILVNKEVEKSNWILENNIGYTCIYGSVLELKKTLEFIIANPIENKRKGIIGRKLYEEKYNWMNSVRQIDEIIKTQFNQSYKHINL